ncbi:Uncharacterised protein [Pandoraea pulmonicola]|uniref:Uncharacterized protein n=1 Tax=Pandoraea pulmonicola TaxID=93221 RepID=A0AAJ4Z972_PANPU|nr:Uncharacterised protein [Pandoraea pulmonicola]
MSFQLSDMHDVTLSQLKECDLLIATQSSETRGQVIPMSLESIARESLLISQSANGSPGTAVGPFSNATLIGIESVPATIEHWFRSSKLESPVVAIDVSCMPRPVMAATFEAICRSASNRELTLVVGYAIASYSPPPTTLPPNEDIRPISDWFAGWPSDSGASTALVVGLGYERAKAEGACEYFDASETWVFFPCSPLFAYDEAVVTNNTELMKRSQLRDRLVSYRVDHPTEAFGQLASVTSNLLSRTNPVLLPFGPKIFFALNLLVGAIYREIGVWHVTGDSDVLETSNTASDHTVAFRARLSPT